MSKSKILSIDCIPLDVGFAETFRFGTVERKRSSNVLLRIETEDGIVGWGEACPVRAFSGETQGSVCELVEDRVKPILLNQNALQPAPLLKQLEPLLLGCPFTLAAIDIALWDIAGKAYGVPISTLLGGRFREEIEMHGSIGIDRAEAMVEVALSQRAHGYTTTKMYAGRDELAIDIGRIQLIRDALGDEVNFILDVNGLWDITTCIRALPQLDGLGVTLLEQPLPRWDRLGQQEAVQRASMDIVADEAVFRVEDVASIGSERTARAINVGVSRLGGITNAQKCATVAESMGLRVLIGSVLELGVATAAGLHLAASQPELPYPSYLIGPIKYERDITVAPLQVTNGAVSVPKGPGLGIELDTELIAFLDLRSRAN